MAMGQNGTKTIPPLSMVPLLVVAFADGDVILISFIACFFVDVVAFLIFFLPLPQPFVSPSAP